MAPKKGRVFIGTSGWNYPHWRRGFYPDGMPPLDFLPYYSQIFASVEVNKSFYRLLSRPETRRWAMQTPPGFVFAVKGSRFITHMLKLNRPGPALSRFFAPLKGLGQKLGPILFQLPPRWNKNLERLSAFTALLPPGNRYAFEFRDPRWIDDDVIALLTRRRMAFCVYDFNGFASPRFVSAPFVYVRLHGPGPKYQGLYGGAELDSWMAWISRKRREGRDVYVYFDNDQKAFAVRNARELSERLRREA